MHASAQAAITIAIGFVGIQNKATPSKKGIKKYPKENFGAFISN